MLIVRRCFEWKIFGWKRLWEDGVLSMGNVYGKMVFEYGKCLWEDGVWVWEDGVLSTGRWCLSTGK